MTYSLNLYEDAVNDLKSIAAYLDNWQDVAVQLAKYTIEYKLAKWYIAKSLSAAAERLFSCFFGYRGSMDVTAGLYFATLIVKNYYGIFAYKMWGDTMTKANIEIRPLRQDELTQFWQLAFSNPQAE